MKTNALQVLHKDYKCDTKKKLDHLYLARNFARQIVSSGKIAR